MGYNEMVYHIKKNRWIMGTQLTPEVRTAELQNGQTSHSQKAAKEHAKYKQCMHMHMYA